MTKKNTFYAVVFTYHGTKKTTMDPFVKKEIKKNRDEAGFYFFFLLMFVSQNDALKQKQNRI